MEEIFKKLAVHLDKTPAGFPATASGVELKILKRLFTPEEAKVTLGLNILPETVSVIAKRMARSEGELAPMLDSMSKKGLIYRNTKGDSPQYMALQFLVGIWEFNVNNLTLELIKDVNEYIPQFMEKSWVTHKTKQLRVIPISKEIAGEQPILAYEVAEEIIRSQSKIVIADCICRKEHRIMGKGCDYSAEACFTFGTGAYYYEENKIGRAITQEEALAILAKGREEGLVLQPGNSKQPANICMCCGCCCQVLLNIKKLEEPAKAVHSNYYAVVDHEECIGCEACMDRCHMEAITIEDTAIVNLKKCIGCGVCVPVCPSDAVTLMQKDTKNLYEPPANVFETYMNMLSERGNL